MSCARGKRRGRGGGGLLRARGREPGGGQHRRRRLPRAAYARRAKRPRWTPELRAPSAATRDMYLDERGESRRARRCIGHLSAAVPGLGASGCGRRTALRSAALERPGGAGRVTRARLRGDGSASCSSYTPRDVMSGLRRFPESARVFLPKDARRRGATFPRSPSWPRRSSGSATSVRTASTRARPRS